MSTLKTAAQIEELEQGAPTAEESAATATQTPNSPDQENNADSGVQQTDDSQDTTLPVGDDIEQPSDGTSDGTGTDSTGGAEDGELDEAQKAKLARRKDYQRLLAKNRDKDEQLKKLQAMVAQFGGTPAVNPFAPNPSQQPAAQPTQVAPVTALPMTPQVSPIDQQLMASRSQRQALEVQWGQAQDAESKNVLAQQYNELLAREESLKEQKITENVLNRMQAANTQQRLRTQLLSEVHEVNAGLPQAMQFIVNGQVNAASPFWQAMAAKAQNQYGITPTQLASQPEAMAYFAKDVALRLTHGAAENAAFNADAARTTRQKQAARVGLESGRGAAPTPAATGNAEARRAKEIEAKIDAHSATPAEMQWFSAYSLRTNT